MRKLYFLGSAANYKNISKHVFAHGDKNDIVKLENHLEKKYSGRAIATKNGRSALCLALKAYLQPKDEVIINGFTCYAVVEAVKAAGMTPIYADISKEDLNFTVETLASAVKGKTPKAIVIQNTLGNPVDITKIEKFAKEHNLIIIEDLAHSAGIKYADGREAGTVGDATILSFGKEKSIDTISGGAVILRNPAYNQTRLIIPGNAARLSDNLRARFYPLFGAMARGLTHVHLSGALMKTLLKLHWVEKSADNRLDLTRKISGFEAKLALEQLKALRKDGEGCLRDFYLVNDREKVLKELRKNGYFFDGIWYERPVSPERYYKKVHFPEENCENAVFVAKHIVNLPTYYTKTELNNARKIIESNLIKETNDDNTVPAENKLAEKSRNMDSVRKGKNER